jgi:ATP-dependent helicase HepA
MKGFFVKHTYRGIGQISEATGAEIVVRFLESGETATFDRDAFSERELARVTLPLQSRCVSDGRDCTIDRIDRSSDFRAPNLYEVTYLSDGLRAKVSEVDLSPSVLGHSRDPLAVLAGLTHGGYSLFQVRENLVSALNQQLRQGSGLRALLSSRIDLRPHQAYVAGLVLLDAKRRFLLADEVGLGKTIEAGIVIHDLLINTPTAKILVVCPGALTQQWLCELYSKFGGHVFKLLELHASDRMDWSKVTKLIAPFSQAAYQHAEQLLAIPWDMVVIDEAHHLLASESLYEFALRLSNNSPSLLLLSAIPAQRREDEFLRLLGLLDPQQYTPEVVAQRDRFRELFEAQRAIGRKLRLLRRRLDGVANQEFTERVNRFETPAYRN